MDCSGTGVVRSSTKHESCGSIKEIRLNHWNHGSMLKRCLPTTWPCQNWMRCQINVLGTIPSQRSSQRTKQRGNMLANNRTVSVVGYGCVPSAHGVEYDCVNPQHYIVIWCEASLLSFYSQNMLKTHFRASFVLLWTLSWSIMPWLRPPETFFPPLPEKIPDCVSSKKNLFFCEKLLLNSVYLKLPNWLKPTMASA